MVNLSPLNPSRLPRAPFVAALAALGALTPGMAAAQSNEEVQAQVGVIAPLSITKLADLDFGDIIPSTGGTVVLSPTVSPTCAVTGAVLQSGICQPASFGGVGAAGQRVRVRRPIGNAITLTGPGADMTISDITINGDPTLTPVRSNVNWERYLIASADGTFVFRVGGTLTINANQAPGLYSGTFDIRIDYQ